VNFFGLDWAVFDHLNEAIDEGNYSAATKNIIRRISIQEQEKFTHQTIDNSEFGLKVKSRLDDIDYSLYYMYIHNRIPVLGELTANGNTLKRFLYVPSQSNLDTLVALGPSDIDLTLERQHPRVHIVGGDFETVVGDFGLRGEGGLFLDMPYLKSDFSYVRKDTLLAGIGLDHTTANNFYYNIQLIESLILDYEELFGQEESTHQLTLNLKKDFLRGNLILEFDCSYNLSLGDRMFNPEVRYKLADGLEAAFGGFIFEGKTNTLFGRYDTNDVIYVEMSYLF
jgi:hypothetical protein